MQRTLSFHVKWRKSLGSGNVKQGLHPGKRLDYLKSVQDTEQLGLDRCVSYAPRQQCPWVPSIVSLVPPHSPVLWQPLSQGAPDPCWEPHLGPWRAPKAALSWSRASASLRMCTPSEQKEGGSGKCTCATTLCTMESVPQYPVGCPTTLMRRRPPAGSRDTAVATQHVELQPSLQNEGPP